MLNKILKISVRLALTSLILSMSNVYAYDKYENYNDYLLINSDHYLGLTDNNDLDLTALSIPRYHFVSKQKDWDYLMEQTYTILGLSIATASLMTVLPESITKWDPEDSSFSNLGSKWKDNVSQGPTWDRDEHFLNYIMHPYFGGVYYVASRHAGFNQFESFLYSGLMSTFFWEYGVESFAEIPSWQDIIITPVFGALVGELMLDAKKSILANQGQVLGSEFIGSVSLFFLNPVGYIHHWIFAPWGGASSEFSIRTTPWNYNSHLYIPVNSYSANVADQFYAVEFKVKF